MLRIYHNHLFRNKAAKQRWKILPAPKGPVAKVCGSRQNPQMWRASVSFFLGIRFSEAGAHTISEMVGTHHLWVRWQVPFSRNPFHPFPYFWRQILLKDRFQHSGVCRFYTQTIFLQFTRIICLDIHFKHTHTHTYTKDRMQHRGVIRLSLFLSNNLSYSKQHVTAQKQSNSFQTVLLSSKSGFRTWVIMLYTKQL